MIADTFVYCTFDWYLTQKNDTTSAAWLIQNHVLLEDSVSRLLLILITPSNGF